MLGNLSKVLFKAPIFFNTMENIESLNIPQEEYTINSFNSKKEKCLYFRERDFWKKNFEPEINFNHNKRLSFYLNSSPKKQKKYRIDKNIINLNKKIRFNTINKKRKYSYLLTDSPIETNPNIKNIKNNFSVYKNNNSIYKKNILGSENRLKTESNRIIKDKYKILNNNLYSHIKINNDIYENNFPSINIYKSQETLFQDKTDNKLKSLILIKPEIKEQLKTKNRNMVGKRDFLKYLNYRKTNRLNPFYESMKIKEDMNNYNLSSK